MLSFYLSVGHLNSISMESVMREMIFRCVCSTCFQTAKRKHTLPDWHDFLTLPFMSFFLSLSIHAMKRHEFIGPLEGKWSKIARWFWRECSQGYKVTFDAKLAALSTVKSRGTSNKKWPGGGGGGKVRMLRVPNSFKNFTIGCANFPKIILLGTLFYTQGFTCKNYWNCLRVNAGLKNKL